MIFNQKQRIFHKENNLEIKELQKYRKKRLRQRSEGREAQRK